ncbi:MAG: hypothetical protein HYV35_02710 [Lentisphaerae bacterium]|nr:hypothetical protein [Lentisphaerota bacterium]
MVNPNSLESDLVALVKAVPGAGRVCTWIKDGRCVDGLGPADSRIAIGAVWTIPHVADGVEIVFTGPAPQDIGQVQVFDGARWIAWSDNLAVAVSSNTCKISFAPVATDRIRVGVPAGSSPARIAIHRYMAEGDSATWPRHVATDTLSREILAREEEPSFEMLARYGLSMPNWALTGLKDSPCEQGVAWDGEIHCLDRRITLAVGAPPVYLADVRDTVRRRLMDGWLPAVIVEGQVGNVAIAQTSFAVYADGEQEERPAMFVGIQLNNVGNDRFNGPLRIEVRDAPEDPYAGTLGVEIFAPPRDRTPSMWSFENGVLIRNGRPYLASAQPCRVGAEPSVMEFAIALAPGETQRFALAAPLLPWQPTLDQTLQLAANPLDKALAWFRYYWERLFASAMKLDLPEKRLNHLHRAVLAQLFINADGNILPYGAAPSTYDGAVYGVEEGYGMRLLAMSGFGNDVKRYMEATYLRPKFMAKADVFTRVEDRNQQIRNGLEPAFAVELFRLTGDRQWISRHVQLLQDCAEWTIANRRKTMRLEAGQRPIHYGLLPMWAFSGDIHEPCYPLFPNFACWRGLADTAWLLKELGSTDLAARYRREADDYRKTLLQVVDALYRKDVEPPFLPLDTTATAPSHGDYYQLFGSLLMDLLPFECADRRARYIGDFLEADNRVFCGLPRLRRNIGDGGIDAIYGLGYIMSLLHQERVREFLIAVYAYQVFNMEHACFTSRESNRIFASDLHVHTPHPHSDWSGPLPCSSAAGALLVRHMVVTEETLGMAEYTGKLLLLHGAPRRWYEPGKRIAVENAATYFGQVSFAVEPSANGGNIVATVIMPEEKKCSGLSLRLRDPQGRHIISITVNGKPSRNFNVEKEAVEIPHPSGTLRIVAEF